MEVNGVPVFRTITGHVNFAETLANEIRLWAPRKKPVFVFISLSNWVTGLEIELSPALPLYEGNKKIDVITDLHKMNMYTKRTVDFIARNKDKPFFLFFSHSMPHVPLGVSEAFRRKNRQGMFGDVMPEIDHSAGGIIRALDDYCISRNTWVLFTSNNGPWLNCGNHMGRCLSREKRNSRKEQKRTHHLWKQIFA